MQNADEDIERYLPQFSLKSLDEVAALLDEQHANPSARIAQRALADELTTLVHGVDAARAASDAAGVLSALPGIAASKSEARRLLTQKSVRANGVVLGADADLGQIPLLHDRWLLLRKGKTTYHLVDFGH